MPTSVSPLAADLIKRMLVVDPTKRISMEEVMQHPWYNRQPNSWQEVAVKEPVMAEPFTEEQIRAGFVDQDVLDSFKVLGYVNDEVLTALISDQPNVERVFYAVLLRRKQEHLENYQPEGKLNPKLPFNTECQLIT